VDRWCLKEEDNQVGRTLGLAMIGRRKEEKKKGRGKENERY